MNPINILLKMVPTSNWATVVQRSDFFPLFDLIQENGFPEDLALIISKIKYRIRLLAGYIYGPSTNKIFIVLDKERFIYLNRKPSTQNIVLEPQLLGTGAGFKYIILGSYKERTLLLIL